MQKLYILYDSRCELCQRLKNWLLGQRQCIPLALIAAGSPKAQQLFPDLPKIASTEDLVVISDNGDVYLNNHAWIMALYALTDYQAWAYRLSHPLLLPLARQAFDTLSKNRHALSRLLTAASPENIAAQLQTVALQPCTMPQTTIHDYLK